MWQEICESDLVPRHFSIQSDTPTFVINGDSAGYRYQNLVSWPTAWRRKNVLLHDGARPRPQNSGICRTAFCLQFCLTWIIVKPQELARGLSKEIEAILSIKNDYLLQIYISSSETDEELENSYKDRN